MSSVKLPWRTLAINETWGNVTYYQRISLIFSQSNASYYDAQHDQFGLIKKSDIKSEWVALVDDDSFVNVRHLQKFLMGMNSESALLIGHYLSAFDCLWGGAGMILSRAAYLRVRAAILDGRIKSPMNRQRNDVEI